MPEPGVPVMPEPGVPVMPEPVVPVMPEPVVPVIPEPGVPVMPEPGVPVMPEPGVPFLWVPLCLALLMRADATVLRPTVMKTARNTYNIFFISMIYTLSNFYKKHFKSKLPFY